MTNYFRPQVRKELQRPLLVASVKLRKPIKAVASEAIRCFVESVLEDNIVGDNENTMVAPSMVESALESVRKIKPLNLGKAKEF